MATRVKIIRSNQTEIFKNKIFLPFDFFGWGGGEASLELAILTLSRSNPVKKIL